MASKTPNIEAIAAEIGAGCLALRARLISRTVTGIYNHALAPTGLTAGQLSILSLVAGRGPIAPGEIALLLKIEKSTMSRNVERMRKKGWLSARAAPAGHQQELALLAKGRKALEKALPAWRKAQKRATALLGETGTVAIHEAANALWRREESDA